MSDPTAQLVPGVDADTVTWNTTLPAAPGERVLTWRTAVADLQPDELREVAAGAIVAFMQDGAMGEIDVAGVSVATAPLLALEPASQTARPGEPVSYALTLRNPSDAPVTYALAIQGLPDAWSNLPAEMTVGAGATVDIDLIVRAETFALAGEYGFTVAAAAASGARDMVPATLVLSGEPLSADAHGVVLALEPGSVTVGQATSAVLTVRITNTGSVEETFALPQLRRHRQRDGPRGADLAPHHNPTT